MGNLVGFRGIRVLSPPVVVNNGVSQQSNSDYLNLHDIPRAQVLRRSQACSGATWRTGENHIAGLQGTERRQVADQYGIGNIIGRLVSFCLTSPLTRVNGLGAVPDRLLQRGPGRAVGTGRSKFFPCVTLNFECRNQSRTELVRAGIALT